MGKNLQMFKNWYNVTRPSKKYWSIAFVTQWLHGIFFALGPIFAAKVIIGLTEGDVGTSVFYLSVTLFFLIMRNVASEINYAIYGKLTASSFMPLQQKILRKIINADSKEFKKHNQDKLRNVLHTSVFEVADFSDLVARRSKEIIKMLVVFIAIFTINVWAGLLILGIDVLNYFILNFLYAKIAYRNKTMTEVTDKEFAKFSDIFKNKDVLDEMNLNETVEKDFLKNSQEYINQLHKRTQWESRVGQTFYVFWNILVFVITLFLIFMVIGHTMTLEMYLIIVPYLTTGIEACNSFYVLLTHLKNVNVHTNRIKQILELQPKEMVEFGNNECDDIQGSIDFYNVSYVPYKHQSVNLHELKNINFHIRENENTLILGPHDSGKRTIFYLLRRQAVPSEGKIYISGENITEFNEKTYSSNFTFLTTQPFFFKGSIMRNLKMTEGKRSKIFKACQTVGIHEYIMNLPKKYNSDVYALPKDIQYLVGLARTLLTRSEIIVLYEFPTYLTDKQLTNIKNILLDLQRGGGGASALSSYSPPYPNAVRYAIR